jgi:cobalt-zinc-cadmium efflux system outer membrane protein
MNFDLSGRRSRRVQTLCHLTSALGLLVALAHAQPSDTLTLARTQTLLRQHPSLIAAAMEIEARKRQVAQAGMLSNPSLSIEAENFAGTGPLSGVQGLETTTRLEQTVELGGKRFVRREQAKAETRIAESERSIREAELSVELWEAYSEALRLQERLFFLEMDTVFLGEVVKVAQRRTQAGGGGVAEEGKLWLSLSKARIEAAKARTELDIAFQRLALLLSLPQPDFGAVREPNLGLIPEWDSVIAALEMHPQLIHWKSERELRALSLRSARAQNMPDLSVNAGVRHSNAGVGNWGIVGGVSVPLPVWNRNKGAIAGSETRIRSSELSAEATRRELTVEAFRLWSELRFKSQEIASLHNELLPQAVQVRDATRSAYSQGRIGVLELLDGHRTWLDLNEHYIALRAEHRLDVAKLEALMSASNL